MDKNLENLIRAVATRGERDNQGHRSESVETLAKELGIDVPTLRDLVELHWAYFDCIQTRKTMNGLVQVGLSPDGRQAAHQLGVPVPSPLDDARVLLDHLASLGSGNERGRSFTSSERLKASLGWTSPRLSDAAEILESADDARVNWAQGGSFSIALTAQARASSIAPIISPSPEVTSAFLNGFLGEDVTWQPLSGPPDERFVHIELRVGSSNRPERRATFNAVLRFLQASPIPWLAPGKKTWKVNVPLFREAQPWLEAFPWLGDADIDIEPEFEDREREIFGRRSYEGVVSLHLTPDLAIPPLAPEAARTKIVVFHGPDNATKNELIAWLRGPDVQADARTVGEMPANADGSVNDRVQAMLQWADKAIAIVTRDDRSPSGAPNVIDEIGRCLGAGRAADLAIVRDRVCADVWSNIAGVVRVEFESRVKEAFLPLARFLGVLGPR